MNKPFPKAAPDFSDPIGLVLACHERMLGHCELLERLAAHLKLSGADDDALAAAAKAHRYFSTAAQHHHDDEEQDIFPRAAHASNEMADVVKRLQQDHEALNQAWRDLGPMLVDPHNIGDTDMFERVVEQFCSLYRDHIAREEAEFFSQVKQTLSNEDLQQIGAAMQQRRQPSSRKTD